MKQSAILFAGAMVSTMVFGSSTSEHEQAMQRQRDLQDKTPMTAEEAQLLKRLLEKGVLKIDPNAAGSPPGQRKPRQLAKGNGKIGRNGVVKRQGDANKKKPRGQTKQKAPGQPQQKTKRTDHAEPTDDTSYYYDDYY